MTTPATSARVLLRPAVAALRAALRRLDDDEVPAALRRVARTSGGGLPPPLQRKLLEVVEDEPWLREKALDELSGPQDGPAGEASRLFLERPTGWWERLAELATGQAEAGEEREVERLTREVEKLEASLEEAQRRLREASSVTAAAPSAEAGEVDELRAQLSAARKAARKDVEEQQRASAEAAARADVAGEAAQAAGAYADRLRAELRRSRRERAALQRELDELRRSPGVARRGAMELARLLDDLVVHARPAPPAGDRAGPEEARPAAALRLPSGVRPDGADAIDWLMRCEEPVLVLVDGYNASYHLSAGSFSTPAARQRLNHELGRLAILGRSLRVVVVYDSSLAGPGEGTSGPAGVEVVFAAAGRLADEEIVERAAAAEVPVVVVSTDREVREAAEQAGALPLWGESLATWIRKRS